MKNAVPREDFEDENVAPLQLADFDADLRRGSYDVTQEVGHPTPCFRRPVLETL